MEILQEKNWLKQQINRNQDIEEEEKWGRHTNNSISSRLSRISDTKKDSKISSIFDRELLDRESQRGKNINKSREKINQRF